MATGESRMSYVLVRKEDGKFVARPGAARSYTTSLASARIFQSLEAAKRDACGNETPRKVFDL